jgi:hypothetical protein
MSGCLKFNYEFLGRIFVFGVIAIILLAHSGNARAVPVTIDMSDHGGGTFNRDYFQNEGVVFTEGDFVGYVQGDDALIFDQNNGLSGLFTLGPVTDISVEIAPWLQGTWAYRLAALDGLSSIIDSEAIVVTQDTGDPEHSGFGYFSIELTGLPGAVGFLVESTFIRTSYGTTPGNNVAALSEMSFTTTVPEPATLSLFGIGLAGLRLMSRRRTSRK